ncbi:MAG: hypothetical protein Q8L54_12255 [Devosia sp.]|nr:hypothetical protein [Devosia sp.]
MSGPTGRRRLLFISNGIGEDSVGAEIVRRLPPGLEVEAYPTLGAGRHYDGVCKVVGPRAELASQGSRVGSGTVARDIASGGLATIPAGLAFLRRSRNDYDHHVVIGDFIGVAGCWLSGVRGITYLDVYRTGYGRPYSAIERWIVASTCGTVFNRSERLAETLIAAGVDARAAGNVMMDTIPSGDYGAPGRRTRPLAVTLLPGSRDRTAADFSLQIAALAGLPEALRPDIFVAVADGIEVNALARASALQFSAPASSEQADLGRLTGRGLVVHLARGAFGNLLAASDLVLSQAGTATIQALGSGKPVITFTRPADRMKRFLEENRLFGEARLLVAAEPSAITAATRTLLADPEEMARLGAIGHRRIGGPGAMSEIIAAIVPQAAPSAPGGELSASP